MTTLPPGPALTSRDKVNILLVDDQPSKLLTYEVVLDRLGENLIKAASAREALVHLLRTEIAVILIDVCMPELDGFELAKLIQDHPRYQKTAIIFVSAIRVTELDQLKGFHHGAVDYVSVPVEPEILRARVSVFAELYRKNRQLEALNQELEQRVAARTIELVDTAARLREREEQLVLALGSAEAVMWSWNTATDQVTWSSGYSALYGDGSGAEATLASWLDRVHPQDREELSARCRRMPGTPGDDVWREEFRIVHPQTGERWIAGRGCAVRDGNGRAFRVTGIHFDITERKHAQDERLRLLECERAARADAERANRAKDSFLAMVSHELRTPLNGVLLWAQLLRQGALDRDTHTKGVDAIERNARAQARLIEEMTDMSRVTSGKLRLNLDADVRLDPLIENALTTVRHDAEAKGIQIRKAIEPQSQGLVGDPVRLQQVLWNLLSNAVKFTPEGGEVVLKLACTADAIEISVSDTGCGIEPDFLPHVFDPFRQADDSLARRFGGLGLGLAIAKNLTELHGGAIAVESAGKGHGSTFRVRLPIASETCPRTACGASFHSRAESLRDIRMLVVDDDVDMCNVLCRTLSECGVIVESASSAAGALSILTTFRPQVLISDIGMPGRDGFQLIRELRAQGPESFRSIPAIAATAYARPEDRAHALQAGYNGFITKPIDRVELLTLLSICLEAARQQGS